MKSVNIYILEDDSLTQQKLKHCIEGFGYEVCGMSDTAEAALQEIKGLKPDFAVLDIRAKGQKNGIWLAKQLDIPFIYLTACKDKSTINAAIKTQPSSYLIKPFDNNQLYAAIQIAMREKVVSPDRVEVPKIQNNTADAESHYKINEELVIKVGYKYYKVNIDDIDFVRADKNYLELQIGSEKHVLRSSIINFMKDYASPNFTQVHKSYVVNTNKVESFSSSYLFVRDTEIPLSRTYKSPFFEQMESYKKLGI